MILFLVFVFLVRSSHEISGESLTHYWQKTVDDNSNLCASNPSWTLLPNAKDCRKFYICVNKQMEEYSCAANYYFDKKELRCKIGECPYHDQSRRCESNDVQRLSENCNGFAVCIRGKLLQRECPAGHYFSPKYASCQSISNSAEHKCSCLLPQFAAVSNPQNCETYYVCIDGKAELQQCPRGQYYNERVSSCLPDLQGICLMAPTMSPAELAMLDVCDNLDHNQAVFQQDSDNCDKFFLCLHGRAFHRQCPEGFFFNKSLQYCQRDKYRKCQMALKRKQIQTAVVDNKIGSANFDKESEKPDDAAVGKTEQKPLKRRERKHKKIKSNTSSKISKNSESINALIIENNPSNEEANRHNKRILTESIASDNYEKRKGKILGSNEEIMTNKNQEKSIYDKLSSKFISF